MKQILISLLLSLTINGYSQETPADDTIVTTSRYPDHDKTESVIKTNRSGKGNSSFTHVLPKLQGIVNKATLKTFEAQLGDWQSFASDNTLGYEWNDKTRNHDIPLYQVKYETTVKGKHYVLTVEVPKTLESRINKLTITVVLNGMELAKFKQSLQSNGYLVNENLTEIFRKQTWQKKGQPTVTIKKNANGTVSIGIF